ncbi:uncharacterized protein LOC144740891 isoform X3 [Lampetra planeri]
MAECSPVGKLSLRVHNDGYLHVKNQKDKEYKKQWTVLNGNVLYFYADKREKTPGHVGRRNGEYQLHKSGEKIFLKSPLTITTKYLKKIGSSTAKITLKTGTTEVKLRFKVPEDSHLPSEDLQRVHKAIEAEKRARLAEADSPSQLPFSRPGPETPSHALPPLPVPKPQLPQQSPLARPTQGATSVETDGESFYSQDLLYPSCYYKVDRVEAEKMLQEHPELGNLLVRPASNNADYSVSVCHVQPLNRPHRPQHYKVTHKHDGYIIELTKKVEVTSLHGVVDYFVKATNGMLTPYVQQTEDVLYEDTLETEIYTELYVGAESEPNSTGQQLSANKLKPVLPPKIVSTDRASPSPSSSSENANKLKPALPPQRLSTNFAPPSPSSENANKLKPALPPQRLSTNFAPPSPSSENANKPKPALPPQRVSTIIAPPSPSSENVNHRKALLPPKRFSTKTAPTPSPFSENADQWAPGLPPQDVPTMTAFSPSPTPENDDNWIPVLPPKGVITIKEVSPSPGNGMDELKRAIGLRRLQIEGIYE